MWIIFFIILTTLSSLGGHLLVQEKSENNFNLKYFKLLTKGGWIMFAFTIILGLFSIYLTMNEQEESKLKQSEEIKMHQKDSINLESQIKILSLENSILKSKADSALFELNGIKTYSDEIQQVAKRIQFPLPSEIELSFDLNFKLNDKDFEKFYLLIQTKNMVFKTLNPGEANPISLDVMKEIINWDLGCYWITINFAKNYKGGTSFIPLFSLTNWEYLKTNSIVGQIRCYYFPVLKKFMLSFDKIKLQTPKSWPFNFGTTSTIDLKNTTLLLDLSCTQNMKETEVVRLNISSKELNVWRWRMDNAYSNEIFSTKIKYLFGTSLIESM